MVADIAPWGDLPDPYGLFCAMLQDATAEWRGELTEDLPSSIVTWRPQPAGRSIGAVMLHLIQTEVFWMRRFALDERVPDEVKRELLWDELDIDAGIWPDPPAQPLSWYFELHDRYRNQTWEAVRQWPPAETVKGRPDAKVTLRWVFGHVIQHEAYHGGQVVMMADMWRRAQ
ncbi:MAG: DinB family protein [Fimbriimonadaceae bacterium]